MNVCECVCESLFMSACARVYASMCGYVYMLVCMSECVSV